MAFDTQEPNHIDAMRALHDSIVNNDAIPDVGHILDRHLPSQAHKDLLQTAAMREAQMTHEGGEPSSFDDSLLGNATHLITSLPERTAARLSSLLSSEDPHNVAGAVKFLGETARERQQRMEEDAMGAVSLAPEQSKNVMIGVSRLPMRVAGAPVDIYTSQGLETIGGKAEDRHPIMGSEWLIDKAIKYGLAPERTGTMEESVGDILGSLVSPAGELQAVGPLVKIKRMKPTVGNPKRTAFPDIYLNPKELVSRAPVAEEDPLMQRLFGVTRQDLFDIAQEGKRQGNVIERPFLTADNPRGAEIGPDIMTRRNAQRLQDIITESKERPELYKGMASWYTMDPLYNRFEQLYGKDLAPEKYNLFNKFTGMASPGSEVLTELNRGTAAHWLANQGRFEDFVKYGGSATSGGIDRPSDLSAIMGHPYHRTSQAIPMQKLVNTGDVDMTSAKVPTYIMASGVPETGFQTRWPVGDAHWSRLVGLPDVRGTKTLKGKEVIPGASATVSEMATLSPWFREKVAEKVGLEAVPAQAVIWGAGANATGVTSPIGAPKLELLAKKIGETADRLGISPETARDLILTGKAHAGFADPELLAALGLTGGLGTLAYKYRDLDKDETE